MVRRRQINAKKSANLDKSKYTLIGLTNSWIESIPEDHYKEKTLNNYICVLSKWVLNNPKRNKLKENWVLEKLNVPFDDITGIMWMDYFAWIRREGSDIIAGSVLKLLKTIVKWHHKNKGNITNLSLLHYVVSDVGAASQPAERCPSAEEIANMWLAIDKSKSLPQTKLSLKLIMLMGARNSTVREMKWEHLDFDKNIWTIPQPKRKLEKPRRAAFEGDIPVQRPEIHPIPGKVRELLLEFSKIYGTRGFIFKGERTNQPITTHALNRFCTRMSFKLFKEKGISKIVPHDFRRSIDSILCEIDIMWDPICEKILGHKLKGTKRHYNKAEYLDQQLEAYNLYWSIIDKKIIELTRR